MVSTTRLESLPVLFVLGQVALAGCLGGGVSSDGSPDTVSVNGTVTVDPSVTYYPENDTVRYGALRQGADVAEHRSVSFETYASWKCSEVAMRRLGQLIEREVENQSIIVGFGTGSGTVTVDYLRSVDRERVDRQLPDQFETTVTLFDRPHTCTIPVVLNPSSGAEPLDVAQPRVAHLR